MLILRVLAEMSVTHIILFQFKDNASAESVKEVCFCRPEALKVTDQRPQRYAPVC